MSNEARILAGSFSTGDQRPKTGDRKYSRNVIMKQSPHSNRYSKIWGYLAIPHELLHVLGYRLVGQRCHYRWGDPYVTPVGPMARRRRLVGKLFPFAVFAALFLVCAVGSGFAYRHGLQSGSFFWFVFWTVIAFLFGLYAGSAIGDLRSAYLLILNKPWYAWTPFDVFFWPIIDWEEIRKKIAAGEYHDKQN